MIAAPMPWGAPRGVAAAPVSLTRYTRAGREPEGKPARCPAALLRELVPPHPARLQASAIDVTSKPIRVIERPSLGDGSQPSISPR